MVSRAFLKLNDVSAFTARSNECPYCCRQHASQHARTHLLVRVEDGLEVCVAVPRYHLDEQPLVRAQPALARRVQPPRLLRRELRVGLSAQRVLQQMESTSHAHLDSLRRTRPSTPTFCLSSRSSSTRATSRLQ
jgi:hypothetical protein